MKLFEGDVNHRPKTAKSFGGWIIITNHHQFICWPEIANTHTYDSEQQFNKTYTDTRLTKSTYSSLLGIIPERPSQDEPHWILVQESRAVARKPRDAAAVLFGLKFADNIHYKFKSSQASKARLFKVIQSHVFWSQWKGDKAISNTI